MPGTSLAIAKRTLALVSPVFTAPSEKTVKLTLGGLFTVTAGTPAACSTVKAEAEFVAESLPATAPAATMVSLSVVPVPGVGAGADDPPPPQPARAKHTDATTPHPINERVIASSIVLGPAPSSVPVVASSLQRHGPFALVSNCGGMALRSIKRR